MNQNDRISQIDTALQMSTYQMRKLELLRVAETIATDARADLQQSNDELAAQNAVLREAIERNLSWWDRDGNPCTCDKCAVCGLRQSLSLTPPAALAQLRRELRKQGMREAIQIINRTCVREDGMDKDAFTFAVDAKDAILAAS